MIEHSINQRAGVVTGSRMYYHSLWFVHNEQIVVLIEDIERNIFRFCRKLFRFRHCQTYFVSCRELRADFCRGTVYEHSAIFDQALETGSGEIRKLV